MRPRLRLPSDWGSEQLRTVELAATPSEGTFDQVLRVNASFSLGDMKPLPEFRFGSSCRAFGTPGIGGSFAYADPAVGIGFAYTPNRSGYCLRDDPREIALREALHGCLARLEDDPLKERDRSR